MLLGGYECFLNVGGVREWTSAKDQRAPSCDQRMSSFSTDRFGILHGQFRVQVCSHSPVWWIWEEADWCG